MPNGFLQRLLRHYTRKIKRPVDAGIGIMRWGENVMLCFVSQTPISSSGDQCCASRNVSPMIPKTPPKKTAQRIAFKKKKKSEECVKYQGGSYITRDNLIRPAET